MGYVEVHSNFRAIFTSNSEEYVGVHQTQNALADRLISIHMEYPDLLSEMQIVSKRSTLDPKDIEIIVNLARSLRLNTEKKPSIRGCIAVARVLAYHNCHADADNPIFQSVCHDVFGISSTLLHQLLLTQQKKPESAVIQKQKKLKK